MKVWTASVGIVLAGCAMSLSGCGSGSKTAAAAADATNASAVAADAKRKGYVEAFNTLIGMHGGSLAQSADAYASYHIDRADVSDTIGVTFFPAQRQAILDTLTKARALPAQEDGTALDRAADRLIAPLTTIARLETQLNPYYSGRAYRQDGLALGKTADTELKAAYAAALAALAPMEAALNESQQRRNVALIARLRADGHVAEASLTDAVQKGSLAVAALSRNDDAAAAPLFATFQQAVEQMRKDQPRLVKRLGNDHTYNVVLEQLTKTAGLYSDYRNGNARNKEQILSTYNQAVSLTNGFPIPS